MIGTGLGSAFGQMMQGDMNAQQMNRQQDQSDRLAEQFDMLKTNFDNQQTDLFKQKANEAIYNAKEYGDYSGFDALKKQFPNQMGDETIRQLNDSDYMSLGPDGAKGIGGQIRNKFLADTGLELPEDPADALKILQGSGLVEDNKSGVSSFVTPDQLGKGIGSGYGMYEEQKKLQEEVLRGKIKGKLKDEVTEMDYLNLDNKIKLGGFGSLSPMEQSAYNLGTEKFKMSKPQARGQLYSADSAEVHSIIDKGENLDSIDDATMNFYLSAEDANGSTPKNKVAIQDTIGSVDAISSIQRDWANLSQDEIASGLTENAVIDVAKLASTEKFQEASIPEQKQMLKTIALRSKTGMFGAKFLNAISGAAVSEEEYGRIMGVLTGGKINQVGVDTIVAALGGAAEGLYDDANGKIKAIGKDGTGSKIELSKSLQRAYNLDKRDMTSTGEGTIEDVAKAGATDQANQAGKVLDTAIIEPIKEKVNAELEQLPLVGEWFKSYRLEGELKDFKAKVNTMSKEELAELAKRTDLDPKERKALRTARMKSVRG